MKRLPWLLVPVVAFALGAAQYSRQHPQYVPEAMRHEGVISQYECDLLRNDIAPPIGITGRDRIVALSAEMAPRALLVSCDVDTPDAIAPDEWVARVTRYLDAAVSQARTRFNTAPAGLAICLRVNGQWAGFMVAGQSKILALDASQTEQQIALDAVRKAARG